MYPLPVMVLWSLYCISGRFPGLADLWPFGMGYCAHKVPQKVPPPLRGLTESMICSLYFSLSHHGPFQYKIESWDFAVFLLLLDFFYFNWNGVCRPNWPPTSYITLDELLIWWASSAGITELSPVHAVLGSNPGLYACLAGADPPSHMSSSSQSLLICLFLEAFFAPWL